MNSLQGFLPSRERRSMDAQRRFALGAGLVASIIAAGFGVE